MAKKKILFVFGQSHASAVADAQTWEDKHPTIALRSPKVSALTANGALNAQLPQFPEGGGNELFLMPGTFAGGPQSGQLGDGPAAGTWQTVDCSGKVVNAVRFLTFYNPTASGLNLPLSIANTYPGVGAIGYGSTSAVLQTSVRWQYSPGGQVITRKRTGTQHTVKDAFSVTMDPSTERFTSAAPHGLLSGDEVVFAGTMPTGSTPAMVANTTYYAIVTSSTEFYIATTLLNAQAGTFLTFTGAGSGVTARRGFATPSQAIVIDPPMVPPPEVGEQFYFTPTSGAASSTTELKLSQAFGGLHDIGSALEAGSIVPGTYRVDFRKVQRADGTFAPMRVVCPSRLTHVGAVVMFTLPLGPFGSITADTPYYVTRLAAEDESVAVTGYPGSSQLSNTAGHGLVTEEKVRLVGTPPSGLLTGTDYYVTTVSSTVFTLSLTPGGATATFSGSGSGLSVVRQDAFFHFFISATPGGQEIMSSVDVCFAASPLESAVKFAESFRGSLTGMRIRALTGSNAGTAVPAGDVYLSGGIHTIKLGAAFANAPAAGDTYVIEVPPIDGQDVPFEKWAMFLPWCPFEGRSSFSGPHPVTAGSLSETGGVPTGPELAVIAPSSDVWPNDVMQLTNVWGLTPGSFTSKLRAGQRYFAAAAANGAAFFAATYGGSAIVGTANVPATGSQLLFLRRQEGKTNPFPPGFNYPNHYPVLGTYQPFDGPSQMPAPKAVFAAGLAAALADYYGETIHVVQLAIGGTNLGHTDVPPVTFGFGTNWSDPKRLLSWAPTGDPNNIFQRLLDTLDAAVLALKLTGDEGEGVGVVWIQGEGDSSFEDLANRYLVNGRRFKAAVRQAIKDKGLFSRPASELRWLEPYCQKAPWPYSATVRAAKDVLVAEDPYSGLCEIDDLPRLISLPGTVNNDPIHMTGGGISTLEQRLLGIWTNLGENSTDFEIANMALALIGEPAKVFSLDIAVDQSAQAAECAKFMSVAKEVILESHSWAFATKTVSLVKVATKDALRTDWSFAYELPADMLNVLEVLMPGSTASAAAPQELAPWWRTPSASTQQDRTGNLYAVEPDANGRLILYTNVDEAILRYNKRITPSITVPMKFKVAVARKLAALIAGQFAKGEAGAALAQRLDAMARFEMGDAATTDARHRQNNPWPQQMPWARD